MEMTYLGDLVCLTVGKIWAVVGEACQVGVEKWWTKCLFVAETKYLSNGWQSDSC